MTDNTESAIIFPCEFPIKVFGAANDEFETHIITIVRQHVPDLAENALRSRLSKDQKYLALTITILAKNQAQLDAIYSDLTASPLVVMAL